MRSESLRRWLVGAGAPPLFALIAIVIAQCVWPESKPRLNHAAKPEPAKIPQLTSFAEAKKRDLEPLVIERDETTTGFHLRGDMKPKLVNEAYDECSEAEVTKYLRRTPLADEAWRQIDLANDEWWEGEPEKAIRRWRAVAANNTESEAGLAALSHIGQAERVRNNSRGAIDAFTQLVARPMPRFCDWGNSYHHDACIELSDLHLDHEDLPKALHYTELAMTYPIGELCGCAAMSTMSSLGERCEAIRTAMSEGRRIQFVER